MTADNLVIAGKSYSSRLLVGTGKYNNELEAISSIKASGAEIVTVAVRRINLNNNKDSSTSRGLGDVYKRQHWRWLIDSR